MMSKRCILFITGTRADFGKLKPLMLAVDKSPDFRIDIFATGMHTLLQYGRTANEIYKSGLNNIHIFTNQFINEAADQVLANTIQGLSRFIHEAPPDMIIVHGDRVETLAGAIVGAFNNILVGHIEGGERSGTIDESIRHAVSKLAHVHLVANPEASNRLVQLGEAAKTIHIIGSPDIDIMASKNLPSITQVKQYYQIDFENYLLAIYHPVTTEIDKIETHANIFVDALLAMGKETIVIYPNNDLGSNIILSAYERLKNIAFIKLFPSMRFEYFLSLLKHATLIIGNSSAAIREAPFYGVPSVNIGTRQHGRFQYQGICNTPYDKQQIIQAVQAMQGLTLTSNHYFGQGDSSKKFMEIIEREAFWQTTRQKHFVDLKNK